MKTIILILKIFVALIFLTSLIIGSFVYYDIERSNERTKNYENPEKLSDSKVFKDFYDDKTCFYVKNTEGHVNNLDYMYAGDYTKDKTTLPDVVIHHNKLVLNSGEQVQNVTAHGYDGTKITELRTGIHNISTYGSVTDKGISDNKYFDRRYSASIVEVPCTFNPFTKEEPNK